MLCREERLLFLTGVGGSLNPAASCLLSFPLQIAEARHQTGYEKMCLAKRKEKAKKYHGKSKALMGGRGLALLGTTTIAQGPKVQVLLVSNGFF